ncbi:hypothetical protein E2542_SST14698 [Spatholobus suberectus]|nr:hypothetical protein E2542_SST14698 [Spatholobus suberectus]
MMSGFAESLRGFLVFSEDKNTCDSCIDNVDPSSLFLLLLLPLTVLFFFLSNGVVSQGSVGGGEKGEFLFGGDATFEGCELKT